MRSVPRRIRPRQGCATPSGRPSSNRLELSRWRPFVPVSFPKAVSAAPPGSGACWRAGRRSCRLRGPGFARGSVDAASVGGDRHGMAGGEAGFEDGTVNYLPAVEIGLRHLTAISIDTHARVRCLRPTRCCRHCATAAAHRSCGSTARAPRWGGIIAFNVLTPDGRIVNERLLDVRAGDACISLRTACFCNPGVGEAVFGITAEQLRGLAGVPPRTRDDDAPRTAARSGSRSASSPISPTWAVSSNSLRRSGIAVPQPGLSAARLGDACAGTRGATGTQRPRHRWG